MYRLDNAVDREIYSLAQRKDDGEVAINQCARIGCHLLESGLNALSEVPDLDLKEAEAAILAVRTTVSDRLREPPTPPVETRRSTRGFRLGGLTLTVSTERTDDAESEIR
jgi:hypothetical protein